VQLTLPSGSPGPTEVAAALGPSADRLAKGFTYFDPQGAQAGASGGPLLGTLNVTVIDASAYAKGNVPGASVDLLLADGTALHRLTDARGQTTFADLRLLLPAQVSVSKPLYDATTVLGQATEDLTVYLRGPAFPPPPPPSGNPPPPPPLQTATVGGHVYGFKPPADLVLGPGQRLVAYVRTTRSGLFAVPPFSPESQPIVVAQEGGSWSLDTTNLSPFTVTAELGVEETLGQNLTRFTPLLLGVHRAVQANPDKPVTDADLILDTHLDQQATATFTGLPAPPPGQTLSHQAGVSLDLGSAGLVPLPGVSGATGPQLVFSHLPLASGQGLVFIDEVQSGRSVSVYLRRVFGDVLGGLLLGPFLGGPAVVAPADGQPLPAGFDGLFRWTLPDGQAPNLLQLQLSGDGLHWSAVMPGDTTQVALPDAVRSQLSSGKTYSWTLTGSFAPGFDFTYWVTSDLYGSSWTAYAYTSASFTVP
jgi:hypothetical protein